VKDVNLSGRMAVVSSRVDGWLVLDGASFPGCERTPWEALAAAAGCPGPAKCVLAPDGRGIAVRAEIPIEPGVDLEGRERAARESLDGLAALVEAGSVGTASGSRGEPAGDGDAIQALTSELSWPVVRRAPGRLAVDLRVPGRFCQALLEPSGSGACRARVDLVALGDADPTVRYALAAMLLTLAGAVRLVRSAAERVESRTSVFFEVDLQSDTTARELHHALAALSVAARMAAREASALTDVGVARSYLAARGWAAPFTS
jgi:hypothetical protein